jgi:hypothetical protein
MLSTLSLRPLNRWDHASIRPGTVGSVGDVIVTPRYKQSAPDLPVRFDPEFSGKNASRLGANVTDGTAVAYLTGGGPAAAIDSYWGGRRDFRTCHGWIHQDIRATDRTIQPMLGATPDYSWNNKLATTYRAMHTGDQFLTVPGQYAPAAGDITRGGAFPRITATESTGEAPSAFSNFVQPSVGAEFTAPLTQKTNDTPHWNPHIGGSGPTAPYHWDTHVPGAPLIEIHPPPPADPTAMDSVVSSGWGNYGTQQPPSRTAPPPDPLAMDSVVSSGWGNYGTAKAPARMDQMVKSGWGSRGPVSGTGRPRGVPDDPFTTRAGVIESAAEGW